MKKNNSDEVIVKFENVTKQYGDLVVLGGASKIIEGKKIN